MDKFSTEVIEILKYYVYRLVDPRNGQTFYVGKGKGDRVFAHAKGVLKETKTDYSELKLKTIKEIIDLGLEVIHIIQRYGMDEDTAFEVESALIDAYAGLGNVIHGHDSQVANAETIQMSLSTEPFEELSGDKFMIIKVRQDTVTELGNRYEATHRVWKVNPKKANEYNVILSVTNGIVKDVYYRTKDWYPDSSWEGRYAFDKDDTIPAGVKEHYINKRIPNKYRVTPKGSIRAPILYSK
jgi:hypothetical protein